MAPRSFMDCPLQLQLAILDHLSVHDLRHLSVVNKGFRQLAEPCLYSDIRLTWSCDQTPPLTQLVRTILERPELRLNVRRLNLDGSGFTESFTHADIEPPPLPISALPVTAAAGQIRSTGVPGADQWIRELQAGAVDALVALLISTLPNLRHLCLDSNFTIESFHLGAVFRCAIQDGGREGSTLPKFQFLRDVTFARRTHEWRHRSVNNTPDVLPFFSLPAIQSLSVSIDNPVNWPFTLANSTLTSLKLFRLRETQLEFLLPSLKSLRKLHWNCYYQENLDNFASKDVIDLDVLVEALHHVSETLTDLIIEPETDPDYLSGQYEAPDREIRGSLQGLAKMGHLQKLEIPWAFLMGLAPDSALKTAVRLGEVLPPSLEMLTLNDCLLNYELWDWQDEIFVSGIKAVLGNEDTMLTLPKLQCIEMPFFIL
ncbi:hypothetical protein TrVGV298_002330 [Trichoderma virens]|nr:hypothetical protein TrVGV298_002330 [Trichoderma virens]